MKICEICGNFFKRNSELNRHVRTIHYKHNQVSCKTCKKTMRIDRLKLHLKTHIKKNSTTNKTASRKALQTNIVHVLPSTSSVNRKKFDKFFNYLYLYIIIYM